MTLESEHEAVNLPRSTFGAGILLIAASLLEIFAMAHHPSVITTDIAQALAQIGKFSSLSKWVHGTLIVLLLVNAYGLSEFALRAGARRPLIRAGACAYFSGVIVMIGAALVSGWIVADVATHALHAPDTTGEIAVQLLALCGAANQACAKVGAVAMSAGIGLWSIQLLRRRGAPRGVGVLGIVVGAGVIAGLVFGTMRLDVHGMGLVVLAQSIWMVAVGTLLMRGSL